MADGLCAARKVELGMRVIGATTKAFVSYSSTDEIRNFPELYNLPVQIPIRAPNGIVIADHWRDFMDGTIAISLVTANVTRSYNTTRFWTFSALWGSYDAASNCSNGTSTAGFGQTWDINPTIGISNISCSNVANSELMCLTY
ncbi:hypothetical protein [Leptospira sp. 'Mane']|uniref:hypothetical protein n=1 Tax=Leptospira sp. 'Mane' TaxID=3387407 RepID=UPI00398AAA60